MNDHAPLILRLALSQILALKPGGLLMVALLCNSFSAMCLGMDICVDPPCVEISKVTGDLTKDKFSAMGKYIAPVCTSRKPIGLSRGIDATTG